MNNRLQVDNLPHRLPVAGGSSSAGIAASKSTEPTSTTIAASETAAAPTTTATTSPATQHTVEKHARQETAPTTAATQYEKQYQDTNHHHGPRNPIVLRHILGSGRTYRSIERHAFSGRNAASHFVGGGQQRWPVLAFG